MVRRVRRFGWFSDRFLRAMQLGNCVRPRGCGAGLETVQKNQCAWYAWDANLQGRIVDVETAYLRRIRSREE